MTVKGFNIFKFMILIFGLAVIGCAYAFGPTADIPEEESWRRTYMWISVLAAYLMIFVPIMFPPSDSDDTGGIFISGGLYGISILLFVLISIILAIAVFNGAFESLFWPLMIQAVFFFIFLLSILGGSLVTTQISAVAGEQKQMRAVMDEIRQRAQMLSIQCSSLGENHNVFKQQVENISNDLRYLSPSKNPMAVDIENRINMALTQISVDPIFTSAEASNANAMSKVSEIQILIKQRKAIY